MSPCMSIEPGTVMPGMPGMPGTARPQWQGLREAPLKTRSKTDTTSNRQAESHAINAAALQQQYTHIGGPASKGARPSPSSCTSSKTTAHGKAGRQGSENSPPPYSPEATAAAVKAAEEQLRKFALQEALSARQSRLTQDSPGMHR
eukprot:601144-Pelagomonas_calceolata.AAC.1